ncbi:holin [Loigolactobacillus rennini]|uniref:holin n=1 Tax=Loigolactobacillus rennini TaxID=238013 RepID=UPI0012EDE0E5|nr:holin [Loigolactobacillus rennini]
MQQLTLIAVVLGPIVSGLTQLLKQIIPAKDKLAPVLPLLIGVVIGLIWAWAFNYSYAIYALAGILSGLQAAGYYTLIKKPTTNKEVTNHETK